MAEIVALAGKNGTLTVNAVTVKLSRVSVKVANSQLEFATTGQTADADSQYWIQRLSGLNSWSIDADGYSDLNATAAARLRGDNVKFRPGTGASGTVIVLFGTTYGFSGAVIVESIEESLDAEGNKPDTFRVSLKGSGTLTYTNV